MVQRLHMWLCKDTHQWLDQPTVAQRSKSIFEPLIAHSLSRIENVISLLLSGKRCQKGNVFVSKSCWLEMAPPGCNEWCGNLQSIDLPIYIPRNLPVPCCGEQIYQEIHGQNHQLTAWIWHKSGICMKKISWGSPCARFRGGVGSNPDFLVLISET